MCVWGASDVLELEVVVRTECGCLELYLGPLQEEWVSLTSEPSLHCHTHSHPSEKGVTSDHTPPRLSSLTRSPLSSASLKNQSDCRKDKGQGWN